MSDPAEPAPVIGQVQFVGNLERLEFKPGDKFVLTTSGELTDQEAARIRQGWLHFMGPDLASQCQLLILPGGMQLGVVGEAKE